MTPASTFGRGEIHSRVRIGYYLVGKVYRWHGQYGVDANIAARGSGTLYVAGNADVQAMVGGASFQPDRLTGTFDLGYRHKVGVGALALYVRHQSSHNIDRGDRPSPIWDQLGIRYQASGPRYTASASLGNYFHRLRANYSNDLDLQGVYIVGRFGNRPVELFGNIHLVTESGGGRSGFVDYWIEPSYWLTKNVGMYAGWGLVHDVDQAHGRTDSPIIVGVKLRLE